MSILEKIIRVGLFFLIVLSLFLSFNIWISSSKKETTRTKDATSVTPVNERTNKEVFMPLRLIRKKDNNMELSNSENLISNVQTEIEKGTFEQISQVVKDNAEQFQQYQQIENGFELLYEGKFLLSEYIDVFKLSFADLDLMKEDIYFTKIQVDLNKEVIRFFDYDQFNVYEARCTVNGSNFSKILNKEGVQYKTITSEKDLANKQYYLTDERKLKQYSYILESQSVTRFRNAFFNDPEDVKTNENNQDLTYTSGNERLSIFDDAQSRLIKFEGEIKSEKDQNIYSETFPYIKKLGKNMGNIRYFDRTDNQITYRTFVEGFPVFSEKNKGQVQMTISDDYLDEKTIQILTSMDTIQIPIPSDEEVTLGSTEQVLNELVESGADSEKIQSLIIGYTWQSIDSTKSVVDLTPEWYVCYEGKWYSENELLVSLADSGV